MSINAINGVSNQHQQKTAVQAIKPETQKELQALGINSQNIKTETQAKAIIAEFKELNQEELQIRQTQGTSQTQAAQAQANVQDVKATQQVVGAQDAKQPTAIAGGQAATVQAQQSQPFETLSNIIAQENRLKLGLL